MKEERKRLYLHFKRIGKEAEAEAVVKGVPAEKAEYDKELEVKATPKDEPKTSKTK